jgi:GDP-D-mannose dehydratase
MEYIVGGMIDYVVSPEEKYSVNCFFEEAVKCFGKVGLWDNGGYMVDGQVVAKIDMDLFRPAQSYTLSSTYNYLINSGFWKPQISFQQLVKTMVEYDRNHLAEG